MMVLAREVCQGIEITGVLNFSVLNTIEFIILAVKSFVELVQFIFKVPGVKFFF